MDEKIYDEHIKYQLSLGYSCEGLGLVVVNGVPCSRLLCSKVTAKTNTTKVLYIMPDGQLMFGGRDD